MTSPINSCVGYKQKGLKLFNKWITSLKEWFLTQSGSSLFIDIINSLYKELKFGSSWNTVQVSLTCLKLK